jgi:hypothetical protein
MFVVDHAVEIKAAHIMLDLAIERIEDVVMAAGPRYGLALARLLSARVRKRRRSDPKAHVRRSAPRGRPKAGAR